MCVFLSGLRRCILCVVCKHATGEDEGNGCRLHTDSGP